MILTKEVLGKPVLINSEIFFFHRNNLLGLDTKEIEILKDDENHFQIFTSEFSKIYDEK